VLFLCAVALGWAARQMRVPYPIALVLGGVLLGLIPCLPKVPLDPGLILFIVLPPVLYQAALFTSWRDFRRHLQVISLLAIGLVLATTLAVAVTVHFLIPTLPWAAAFALGAIISPPDAVAATAVLSRFKLSRRVVTILEGESLVNDASGLVLYKFAVAAAVTGTFSVLEAAGDFVYMAAAGIGLGYVMGRAFVAIHKHLRDPQTEIMLSIMLPYATYLLAETLHLSGVLAVVAAGLVRGRHAPEVFSAQSRLIGYAVWNIIVFFMNALVFMIIGSQLPGILARLSGYPTGQLANFALAVSGVAILVRLSWVFPGAYLSRRLSRHIRETEPRPAWQNVIIMGWCGMRGIVSLAAALALPAVTASGEPFPARDLLVFLTFAVIAATLILQGLTLAPLMYWLKVKPEEGVQEEERDARRQIRCAAIKAVRKLGRDEALPERAFVPVLAEYSSRLRAVDPLDHSQETDQIRWLQLTALNAERRELIALWRDHRIGDEVLHRIERELDLEESRLKG
jgi:CPA1 family monovalent cation:H+ antiporter